LIAAWTDIKARVLAQAEAAGIGPDDVLASDQRWISPSDFGFHNALKRPDGTLCFLDFEYAGWDDMAKLASDFFLQPQVPVDPTYADAFLERAAGPRMSASLRARVHILQPVFALKWCVIMMNPFVLDRAQAGKFADPSRDEDERKRTQLTKAQRALQAIKQSEKNGIC
jgi:thiamine kinase-like enzyme